MPTAGGWYDHAEEYWHTFGATEYYNPEENEQGFTIFTEFLRDVNSGYSPEQSFAFWEFLEFYGLGYEDFDWDDFREWYEEQ